MNNICPLNWLDGGYNLSKVLKAVYLKRTKTQFLLDFV